LLKLQPRQHPLCEQTGCMYPNSVPRNPHQMDYPDESFNHGR
jgi:hypothetical protein